MKATPWTIRAFLLALCALAPNNAPASQWLGPPSDKEQVLRQADFDQMLAANPLGAGENIKVVPLFQNERSSNILVQVRDREPLHRHADSDITVFMLRGAGAMVIGEETRAVKTGDVIHIPRDVVHAYLNRGAEPAAAVVVYSPAPGPKDRVLVEAKN